MKTFRLCILVFAVLFVASLGLMSCLQGGTINSITVTPASASMTTGSMQQFTATANFTNGTTLNWTSVVHWSSSNTAVAIVSNTTGSNGIVTAVATGTTGTTTIITATDTTNNLSGNATLAVNNPVSITVNPIDQVISLATTTQQQFTATAIFPPGSTQIDVTALVFWSSSNTGVATFSTGTNGLAILKAVGTTSITATDLITNVTGSTTLTVQ